MQTTVKFRGWLPALITCLTIILQFTAPAKIWTMLFIGLGITLTITWYWARELQTGLSFTREHRYTWAQVGDRLEERFTVTNTSFIPALWLEIEDHSTLPDYQPSRVTGVGSKAVNRWYTDGICSQRGVFQLGPVVLKTGDPFGLFEVKHRYPNTEDFTIMPPVLAFPGLNIATRGQTGDDTLRTYSLSRTQSSATVRKYAPHDSLNRIHWPTTARRNEFFVRNLDPASSGDWWLALDLNVNAHYGQKQDFTLEKVILIASSLADRGLKEKHAVGLIAQGKEAVWVPPLTSAGHRGHILKTLALVNPGTLDLEPLLTRSRRYITGNASLVVITASTTLTWLQPLLLLMRQGVVVTVIYTVIPQTQAAIEANRQILISQGITTHLLESSQITPPPPEDAAGRWEWQITGLGKAVAVHKPQGKWKQV